MSKLDQCKAIMATQFRIYKQQTEKFNSYVESLIPVNEPLISNIEPVQTDKFETELVTLFPLESQGGLTSSHSSETLVKIMKTDLMKGYIRDRVSLIIAILNRSNRSALQGFALHGGMSLLISAVFASANKLDIALIHAFLSLSARFSSSLITRSSAIQFENVLNSLINTLSDHNFIASISPPLSMEYNTNEDLPILKEEILSLASSLVAKITSKLSGSTSPVTPSDKPKSPKEKSPKSGSIGTINQESNKPSIPIPAINRVAKNPFTSDPKPSSVSLPSSISKSVVKNVRPLNSKASPRNAIPSGSKVSTPVASPISTSPIVSQSIDSRKENKVTTILPSSEIGLESEKLSANNKKRKVKWADEDSNGQLVYIREFADALDESDEKQIKLFVEKDYQSLRKKERETERMKLLDSGSLNALDIGEFQTEPPVVTWCIPSIRPQLGYELIIESNEKVKQESRLLNEFEAHGDLIYESIILDEAMDIEHAVFEIPWIETVVTKPVEPSPSLVPSGVPLAKSLGKIPASNIPSKEMFASMLKCLPPYISMLKPFELKQLVELLSNPANSYIIKNPTELLKAVENIAPGTEALYLRSQRK